jgi:hypothetical protein
MRSCHCTQLRYESIRACAAAGKTNVPLALQQKESGTPVKVWTMISTGIAAANAAAPPAGSNGRCQIPHRADTKIAESEAEPTALFSVSYRLIDVRIESAAKRNLLEHESDHKVE